MARRYSNSAVRTSLTAAAAAGDATLAVGDTTGWPAPGVGDVGVGALDPETPANVEIFTYTGKTATSLTGCVRGLDGTTAKAHAVGVAVRHVVSAGDIGVDIPVSFSYLPGTTSLTLTDMPAALAERIPEARHRVDLTNANQVRMTARVRVVGSANAEIRMQWSADETNWFYFDGVDGPKINISTLGSKTSLWVNLVAGAKADVLIRFVTINGDGVADPVVSTINLQAKP